MQKKGNKDELKYIFSLVNTAIKIVKEWSGEELYKRWVGMKKKKLIEKPYAIFVELVLENHTKSFVIYEFDIGIAVKTVGKVVEEAYGKKLEEMGKEEMKEVVKSALEELANQITGRASEEISQLGLKYLLKPPLLVENRYGKLVSNMPFVEARMITHYGELVISILFDQFLSIEEIVEK